MVFDCEEGDLGWPPSNIVRFSDWLEKIKGKIPTEYLHSTNISIDSRTDGDDTPIAMINVSYKREETEEEKSVRLRCEQKKLADIERKELKQLAILKRKYEVEL